MFSKQCLLVLVIHCLLFLYTPPSMFTPPMGINKKKFKIFLKIGEFLLFFDSIPVLDSTQSTQWISVTQSQGIHTSNQTDFMGQWKIHTEADHDIILVDTTGSVVLARNC